MVLDFIGHLDISMWYMRTLIQINYLRKIGCRVYKE